MNTKLLRKVKNQILKYPEAFDMSIYAETTSYDKSTPCGTVACIGGWSCILGQGDLSDKQRFSMLNSIKDSYDNDFSWYNNARKLLGITKRQSDKLFNVGEWPMPYYELYDGASDSDKPKIAARRIEHFIKTGV